MGRLVAEFIEHWGLTLLTAVALSFVAREAWSYLPFVQEALLKKATSLLPPAVREAAVERWSRKMHSYPGEMTRVVIATIALSHARRIALQVAALERRTADLRARDSHARLALMTGATLGVVCGVMNVGLLSEFFSEFLSGLKYLGIPVGTLLALHMTLLVVALGWFIKLSNTVAVRMLLLVILAGVSFIEFVFFARVGTGLVVWPPAWEKAYPAIKLWFGLYGPILVVGLSLAIGLVVQSIETIFRAQRALRGKIQTSKDLPAENW